jgi:hypothetical protein
MADRTHGVTVGDIPRDVWLATRQNLTMHIVRKGGGYVLSHKIRGGRKYLTQYIPGLYDVFQWEHYYDAQSFGTHTVSYEYAYVVEWCKRLGGTISKGWVRWA